MILALPCTRTACGSWLCLSCASISCLLPCQCACVLVIQHSYLSECLSLQVTSTLLYLPLSSITLPSLSAGTVVMFFLFPKPWPNRIASQRKFRNVEFHTQTCSGWPNGLTSICTFSTICQMQSYACPHTKENNSETNLCWVAK